MFRFCCFKKARANGFAALGPDENLGRQGKIRTRSCCCLCFDRLCRNAAHAKQIRGTAIKFQEALTKSNPKNAFTLAHYAETLRMQNKLEESSIKFQESLIIDPKNAFILAHYAETLREQGKLVESAIRFQQALAI